MTLFRKVFQNQARPADPKDAPDEAALHDALRNAKQSDGLVGPDPFVLSDRIGDKYGATEQSYETEDEAHGEPDLTASADDIEEPITAETGDDTGPEDDIDFAEEATQDEFSTPEEEESGNDLVEGILAAALEESDRYEANIPPETDEPDIAEEEAFVPEEDTKASGEDPGPQLEMTDTSSEPEPEPEPEPVQSVAPVAFEDQDPGADPQDSFAPAATSEDPGAMEGHETEPEEEPAEPELDLSAFAREQLTALGGRGAAPAEETEAGDSAAAMPAPAAGRAGRRAGRVKTRLLGFNRGGADHADPIGGALEATASQQQEKFPVGWLVVVEGPGVGHSFSIFTGASMIGRGDDQVIRLDFGDNSISRQNHAAIAYDEEQNKFYIGHGGKSNIIRRNARPVLSTEELQHADLIRIGETTLRFVALCGSDFKWDAVDTGNDAAV